VLVGALLVGDSVRHSLREQALQRIGKADAVLAGGERFFRATLADELGAAAAAPVLQLAGIATSRASERRANDVQVLGVDARFFELALEPTADRLGSAEVLLGERLALQLDAKAGDELLLRVPKPSARPGTYQRSVANPAPPAPSGGYIQSLSPGLHDCLSGRSTSTVGIRQPTTFSRRSKL